MKLKQKPVTSTLRATAVKLARLHFGLTLAYAISIIVFDSWNLMPPPVILQRWTLAAILLVVTTGVWWAARNSVNNILYYKGLIMALVLADLALAAVSVYTERGMASRAVMLFTLPILVSAALQSKRAIVAAAALSTAAYVLAVMRYFVTYPGEGYKIELYGTVGFYSAVFFIMAGLLWTLTRNSKPV